MPRAITIGLRLRNVDVLTAFEDEANTLEDAALFSQDDDLLVEATRRQAESISFGGVIYAHQLRVSIGACIRDLEIVATIGEPDELHGRVLFLPL